MEPVTVRIWMNSGRYHDAVAALSGTEQVDAVRQDKFIREWLKTKKLGMAFRIVDKDNHIRVLNPDLVDEIDFL